ncbi:MAG: hypothetical protein ACI30A_04210 [Paludibacteraceae bacterium]
MTNLFPKRIVFAILSAALCFLSANADLAEDFNTANGTWNSATNVILPSGEWTFGGGAAGNKNGNVVAIKFNANGAYMVSPALDSVKQLSFTYRAGGSNKRIAIAYQVGSGNWSPIDTLLIPSSASAYSSYTKSLGLDSTKQVRIRLTGLQSNSYVDDFKLIQATADNNTGGGIVVPVEPEPDFTRPSFVATNHTYYISPAGNDATGDGSFESPWYNLGKAVSVAQAGDVIFCRGGRYKMSWRDTDGKLTVRMSQSGTVNAPIVISSYEAEAPIFDFEQQLLDCGRNKANVGDRGILLSGNYWVLFGLHIMHAADNAIKLEGSYNRIERCEFSYNLDTGIQLGFGHKFSDSGFGSSNDGTHCAYNAIIDCDSHHNCDCDANYGSDADGFACKMHNGKGNRFIRCRAWRNSDDAWDLYETDFDVILIECWAWSSGFAADHTWVKEYIDTNASFSGNGNGIKLGGNGTGGSSKGVHYAYNCVAFGCNKSGSVKGFDCNSHKGGHVLVNCLAFDNGYDYMFESGGSDANTHFYNNICFGKQEICIGSDDHNAIINPPSKLGWTNHLITNFSKADYQSLSEADAIMPRRGDGSMPARFARLNPESALLDAGATPPEAHTPNLAALYADYPFLLQPVYGAARDLGPYELPVGDIQTAVQQIVSPHSPSGLTVLTGNHSGEAILRYSVPADGEVFITLFAVNGQPVATISAGMATNGVEYYLPLSFAGYPRGAYILTLTAANYAAHTKLLIP